MKTLYLSVALPHWLDDEMNSKFHAILFGHDLVQVKKKSNILWRIINPLQSSGHYMYRQFNIQQFYVLPTQRIYVFCVDLRTNSDYFPIQH